MKTKKNVDDFVRKCKNLRNDVNAQNKCKTNDARGALQNTHTHEGSMYKPIEKPKKKRGGHNSAICHRTYLHIRFGSTFSDYKCKTK